VLPHVVAIRYVTPLREGGSLPGLMEADDLGTYVVKFRGAGQGLRALVAEIIVGELARHAGLLVPELVTVEIDPRLGAAEPDPEIQELIGASTGTNLGVDFLPGALPYTAAGEWQPDPALAAEIVWLDALTTNVDAAMHILDFVRKSDHAGLLHLSTCYVAGARDGRVGERLRPNYTPAGEKDFDAEKEWRSLHEFVTNAEQMAEGAEVTEELRQQALEKEHAAKGLQGAALENQIRKNRVRWLRNYLTEAGSKRARELGWPNTYTLTKSLAESLIHKYGAGLPVAVVRPAIVETSIEKPFVGWNEGINTSASLSYLLGTYFRQLPSNERKRLDILPVDSVCCGMTLVAAAIVARRNEAVYQLATSVTNPCDMRRSIELTSLAHRKHYRAQEGLESWLRLRFDAIAVSKDRYRRMSAPAQIAIIKSIQRIMSPLPLRKPPLVRAERSLERVEKLIQLFEPFILLNEHDFVADNVEQLSHALVPDEKASFGYTTRGIDWWEYWINIHIPALRKWTYPLIEGRPLEARQPRKLQLDAVHETSKPEGEQDEVAKFEVKTGTDGASWRFS